jgi:hypothetical protein
MFSFGGLLLVGGEYSKLHSFLKMSYFLEIDVSFFLVDDDFLSKSARFFLIHPPFVFCYALA